MVDARAVLVLIGFGSLLSELMRFPVPSEASVYQLLFRSGDPGDDGTPLARARRASPLRKVVTFLLPTAIGVVLFLIPLATAVWRPLIDYLVPLRSLETVWSLWGGGLLVTGGRVLTFVSVLQLRERTIPGTLRTSGLFRWSRNPGLLGNYGFYLGLCCLFPCGVLFVGLVPYVWNMHVRVLMEESHLGSRFGTAYASYKTRVPRYVFF